MRTVVAFALALAVVAPSCSRSTPTTPTAGAVIVARAPASIAAQVCTRCGPLVGELEAVFDLTVEETAGVAGQVTAIDTVLRSGSVVIEGPGQFDVASVTAFGGGTNRVSARGSLTLRQIGVHFSPEFRAQLPATWTLVVRFRDDRGNVTSADVLVQVR